MMMNLYGIVMGFVLAVVSLVVFIRDAKEQGFDVYKLLILGSLFFTGIWAIVYGLNLEY